MYSDDRKQETKKVKDALKAAGINCTVGHGTGTAWGWLKINVGSSDQYTHPRETWCECAQCQAAGKRIMEIARRAVSIAQQVTGRHGEYDGEISVLTQKDYDKKNHCAVEIRQAA